ncbi:MULTISPECIES: hypothetical protein [Dactylosporangium]|uniref:Uncharacterized protein n=2 Tax=Dactylosporangium TaxID=35753 RepID=A0A9W6KUU2_9ACTN|nr:MULTISPECIES: hypothetical protein [Dactylosporangium]UAB94002.1 hypothetical protein Dvina_38290 [Dactylosporangium vinaceum]UWZ42413.1 hypothetical protein Dmats_33265 [Dactylosporangium matsuzakiense]GLL07605.1 hypothetical protein GCM10017581_093590 [Dactylosporangium matsuzakiense]
MYINRVERRTFDDDCEFLRAPHHRAAIGTYLADMVRPHGLPLDEDLLATGAGQSYGEMGAALIGAAVGPDEPVDLLVLAFDVPDVRPGRAAATYLSHVCPGNPRSFAVCDQGVAAPFTALRLIRSYIGSGTCRRALLLILEQSTVHYPAPVTARNAGVALVCSAQPGPVRVGEIRVHTDAAGDPDGRPLTAGWWELPATIERYDPALRYRCTATFATGASRER